MRQDGHRSSPPTNKSKAYAVAPRCSESTSAWARNKLTLTGAARGTIALNLFIQNVEVTLRPAQVKDFAANPIPCSAGRSARAPG